MNSNRRGRRPLASQGAGVAIYLLLQNSAFDPQDIACMTTANEKALIFSA
jgi:hypothetical protein